jgi:hypothetical protein
LVLAHALVLLSTAARQVRPEDYPVTVYLQ